MKKLIPLWISAVSLGSIAIAFLYLIARNNQALNDPRVFLAFVAAITAIVTTLGSFYLAGFNAKKKAEQDRATESRKLKIDYYFKFLDALTAKMNAPGDTEINKTFCAEKNRLPLYASTEVVELVERIADAAANPKPTFTEMYVAIRNDLATSEFTDLTRLKKELSFHLAN